MNWKQFAIRIIAAGAALAAPARFAWGQSCNCQDSFTVPNDPGASGGFQPVEFRSAAQPSRRLPAGWPAQWSEPIVSANSQKAASGIADTARATAVTPGRVRDPFTGQMVPTSAQARWDRAATTTSGTTSQSGPGVGSPTGATAKSAPATGTNSSSQSAQKTPANSYSILPSRSGSAAGGAIGGGTGGGVGSASGGMGGGMSGGMGGNSGGSGAGSGTNWSPRTANSGGGGFGGGSSGRSNSGTLGYLANSNNSGSTGSGNNTHTGSTGNSGSTGGGRETPVVTDHGIDVPVVTRPDIPIPDYTPEIPSNEHPSPGGGPGPGTGGDTPIVPEPGSLLLLGIAGAIGGVVVIRRRRNKIQANVTA